MEDYIKNKQHVNAKNLLTGNIIAINNKKTIIETTTCKDFYWHIINTEKHKPALVHKWAEHFPKFHNAESKV